MQKVCLKSLQEDAADDIKQTTFSDAGFLGALRVNLFFKLQIITAADDILKNFIIFPTKYGWTFHVNHMKF